MCVREGLLSVRIIKSGVYIIRDNDLRANHTSHLSQKVKLERQLVEVL